MRSLPLLSTVTVFGSIAVSVFPVSAADMIYDEALPPFPPQAVVEPLRTYDWGGFHFGVDGGYGWGDFTGIVGSDDGSIPQVDLSAKGAFGGVFVGYDYEFADWTLGVEADMQLAKMKEDESASVPGLGDFSFSYGPKWFGSLRLRAGTSGNRFHPYVTGGLAFGKIEAGLSGNVGASTFALDFGETSTGYTIGAGVEYALRKRLIGRLEYQYLDFGEFEISVQNMSRNVPFNMHTVRVGLGIKF